VKKTVFGAAPRTYYDPKNPSLTQPPLTPYQQELAKQAASSKVPMWQAALDAQNPTYVGPSINPQTGAYTPPAAAAPTYAGPSINPATGVYVPPTAKPKFDPDALVDNSWTPSVADMQKQAAENHAKLYPMQKMAPTPVAPSGLAPDTKGLSTGVWIGIAAGGVAVLGLITFLAVRKR
jgi:hypothetical protein